MLKQTRNALLYSDLALFLLDTREGITYQDVELHKWLILQRMRVESDRVREREERQEWAEVQS